MKRCWFGGALLILLLAAGITITLLMGKFHTPISQDLEKAAICVGNAQWEQAGSYASSARHRWEQHRKFSAAFADHEPMEDMDQLFAELEIWLEAQDIEHCAAICAQLSQAAQAMKDAHTMTWWNLL